MDTITITYRSHSADALLREFANNHEQVKLIVFPQDWTPEQCQDEVMRLKPWENGEWHTDETSRPENIDRMKGDRLIRAVAKAVKRSANLKDESDWVEVFSALQKRFDQVVIYEEKIDHHFPFSELKKPKETLIGWLEMAGFQSVSMRSESPFRDGIDMDKAGELLDDVDNPDTLLLADRHNMTIDGTELPGGGILLHLPLLNLIIEGFEYMESFEINGIQDHLKDIIFSDTPNCLA